jgi:hypothetical protein
VGPGGIEAEAPVGLETRLDSGGGGNETASKDALDEIFGSGQATDDAEDGDVPGKVTVGRDPCRLLPGGVPGKLYVSHW